MKNREHYLECANPVWELTHDCATAAFDFNWLWLDEIKAACSHYAAHSLTRKDTYRTIRSVVLALQEVAHEREKLLQVA